MPEISSDKMREAAAGLRAQADALEEAKTALRVQGQSLKAERHEINTKQNDLNQAATALEFQAGEEERGGSIGKPSEAVSALIEAAIASAEGAPTDSTVGEPA